MIISKRRSKYIDKALQVFRQEGLHVSLEEVAEKMGITKKTLYNNFESKDELLKACMMSLVSDLRINLEIMYDDRYNSVDCMRKGFEALSKFFYTLSPIFFYDLKKLYPEIAGNEHNIGFGILHRMVIKNLEKGIKEGVYREDINIELIEQFFTYSIFGFYMNKVLSSNEFVPKDYFKTIVDYHLQAWVSDKGRELL